LAGHGTDHELLEAVVGLAPGDLIAAVSEASNQYLLVPDADRYAFRHVLVAEAVVTDIVPGERIRLHRAIAACLTTRLPSDDVSATATTVTASALASAHAEVAYHWFSARDFGRALIASIDAGLAAERAFALPEARSQFERAIHLWSEAPNARALAQLDLVDLYRHAAELAYMIGDPVDALTLVHRAIDCADAGRDPLRVGLLHERLGRYLLANASSEAATIDAFENAVRLVPDTASAERARVLCGLAAMLMMAGRHAESRPLAENALDVARQVGARRAEAHALCTLGMDLTLLGDVEQGLALQREALAMGSRFDNMEDAGRSASSVSDSGPSTPNLIGPPPAWPVGADNAATTLR
jgi:tetratricopeptide (TPR) repeat protein